jgi:hypothetical protein
MAMAAISQPAWSTCEMRDWRGGRPRIPQALHAGYAGYNVDKLVFYEAAVDANAAIGREKQIKAGSRRKKVALIDAMNPMWRDLYDDIVS